MHITDRTALAPEIDAEVLWYEGWYNGPTDGVCEFEGEKLWFVWTDDDGDAHRVYAVVRIDPEIMSEMVRRREIYEKICGPSVGVECKDGN